MNIPLKQKSESPKLNNSNQNNKNLLEVSKSNIVQTSNIIIPVKSKTEELKKTEKTSQNEPEYESAMSDVSSEEKPYEFEFELPMMLPPGAHPQNPDCTNSLFGGRLELSSRGRPLCQKHHQLLTLVCLDCPVTNSLKCKACDLDLHQNQISVQRLFENSGNSKGNHQ